MQLVLPCRFVIKQWQTNLKQQLGFAATQLWHVALSLKTEEILGSNSTSLKKYSDSMMVSVHTKMFFVIFQPIVVVVTATSLLAALAAAEAESQYGLIDDLDGFGYGRPPVPYARPLGPFGAFPPPIPAVAPAPFAPAPFAPAPFVPAPFVPAPFAPAPFAPAPYGGYGPIYPPSTYQFGYGVQSGDLFSTAEYGHNEEHTPFGTVGSYHVNSPGSFQRVSYNIPH